MTAIVQRVAEWNRIAAGIRREQVLGLVPTTQKQARNALVS